MLDALLSVAPPATWLRLAAAAALLLTGFVVLSHTIVRRNAYGEPFKGVVDPGGAERTMRVGASLVLAGICTWGWELGWPWPVLAVLGALAVAGVVLEGLAVRRGSRSPGREG